MDLKNYIANIPNYPLKGITYRDISPLLKSPEAFHQACVGILELLDKNNEKTLFAGIESRGFIFASYLASLTRQGMVLIRKKGKLPPPVISHNYILEYGEDTLEMKESSEKTNIILIDDVLATGGTLKAAEILCKKANYNIVATSVLIDINITPTNYSINGKKVSSLIQY